MGANGAIVQSLTHTAGAAGPCLVPRLRFIALGYADGFDIQGFLDMIKSRWRLDSVIKSPSLEAPNTCISFVVLLSVENTNVFEPLLLRRLREFAVEVLDIKLLDGKFRTLLL